MGFNWLIKTKSERGVRGFSQPCWSNTFIESSWTFVFHGISNNLSETSLPCLTNLNSSFNNINWMDESNGKDSGGTSAEYVFKKFGHSSVSSNGSSSWQGFGRSECWHWES